MENLKAYNKTKASSEVSVSTSRVIRTVKREKSASGGEDIKELDAVSKRSKPESQLSESSHVLSQIERLDRVSLDV